MRVGPRSLDPSPHRRTHNAERSSRRIAVSKQTRGKLRHAKYLRIGLPHDDGVIKTRDNQGHDGFLSFLDRSRCVLHRYDRLSKRSAFTWKIFSLSISLMGAVSTNRVVRSINAYG